MSFSLFVIMWQIHWQPRQRENTRQSHWHRPQLRPVNSSAATACSSHGSAVIPGFRGGRRDLWKHLWLGPCFYLQELCPSLPTAALHTILHIRDKNRKKLCLLQRSRLVLLFHMVQRYYCCLFVLRQQRNTCCQLGCEMSSSVQSVGILSVWCADDKMCLLLFHCSLMDQKKEGASNSKVLCFCSLKSLFFNNAGVKSKVWMT